MPQDRGCCGRETPRVAGEIVRDLFDGLDRARAHVNSHVLLDADGGLFASALCHACGRAGDAPQEAGRV